MVTRFPASKYAADAAARMKYLVNVLASHEVLVARYYMKRDAYVAAVGRPVCDAAISTSTRRRRSLGNNGASLSGDGIK